MPHFARSTMLLTTLAASVAVAAGCGDDDEPTTASTASTASTSSSAAAPAATSLADVCPSTIVTQTDWNPESDHSELYNLAAPGGKVDTKRKRYTSDLVVGGQSTGVKIEIRAGGPATGFQSPTQQMYADKDIMLGYVNTDESIQNAAKKPTVSVMAPREHWAQVLIYDPATYDFKSIADIGKTDAKVLYFQGNVYMSYLTGADILKKDQVDASYDGKPARFVSAGGKVVQQGFISAEPWQYENQVKPWMKKVATLSIEQSGYPNYGETLAVRKGDLEANSACLEKLVPMIQQAQVDYAKDPATANALIVKLAKAYNTGWVYPQELADFGTKSQLDNDIISNGDTDTTLGDLDEAKVQKMIDLVSPIYKKRNIDVPEGLAPSDLFTNEFIKEGVGL